MKKTALLIALTVSALPLVAQQEIYTNGIGGETLAERNARQARLAEQMAQQQAQQEGDIYRGKVFGSPQQNYSSNTLGIRTPAKTKYVYDTSLIRAIKMNDEDRVRTLIYANVDVNERNYAGITPLTLAAEKGNITIVKYLVDAKANVNESSPYGVTPLIAASAAGNSDVVEYLLSKGANAAITDETGKTPVLYAAHYDDEKTLATLAKRFPQAVNMPDGAGNTSLIYSAQRGYDKNVKVLLANGADANYRNPHTGVGAVAAASAEGHANVIRSLSQANVNVPDNSGRTPLAYAAENGQSDAVRALLSVGANPNQSDVNGVTPLMRAASKGHEDCVNALLRSTNINLEQKDAQGKTALIYSAYAPNTQIAASLLRRGANINATDNRGNTALITALAIANEPVASYLTQQGADTTRANLQGVSPLAAAQQTLPSSNTAREIEGKTNQAYQEALQLEAARLATVRQLEEQLAQDEERVRQLKGSTQENVRAFIEEIEQQYAQEIAEVNLLPSVIEEQASVAQQQAAANAQILRNQVAQERAAAQAKTQAVQNQVRQVQRQSNAIEQTAYDKAAAAQKQQKVAQEEFIQAMPTLQPRLRTLSDPR